jgi:hypothetical protein
MTKTDPTRAPGYRGSLPTREDRMAKPWVLTVIGVFLLVMALSIAGIPSRFTPEETPVPLPSNLPSLSAEPLASDSASADPSASDSVEPSSSP